jgi:hypothetical protein
MIDVQLMPVMYSVSPSDHFVSWAAAGVAIESARITMVGTTRIPARV